MKTYMGKRVVLGILLLLAGLLLMLKYYNIAPWEFPGWVFSWKSLLVLLGLIFITGNRNRTSGITLITIGLIFIAGDIFNLRFWEVVSLTAPLLLISAGILVLLRKERFSLQDINRPESDEKNDSLNDINIFGGSDKKIKSRNFRGGRITAIFGGSDIDMRLASLAPGVNAIELLCLFGGTSIRVPEEWEVNIEVTSLFGGFSDERLVENKSTAENPDSVLYIKGLIIFGGGEVKS